MFIILKLPEGIACRIK